MDVSGEDVRESLQMKGEGAGPSTTLLIQNVPWSKVSPTHHLPTRPGRYFVAAFGFPVCCPYQRFFWRTVRVPGDQCSIRVLTLKR